VSLLGTARRPKERRTLTHRLIRPDTLPVGGCLQDQGNGAGNDDRRRN
jgi:hypothetical protein